jgi:hypothetical protein
VTMAIRSITLVADTNAICLLPVYSGLRAIARQRSIRLSYRSHGTPRFKQYWPGALWLELHGHRGSEPLFVCIDVHDSGTEFSLERLQRCHMYFKRSYDKAMVAQLPPDLVAKMQPYGVFYELLDSADRSLAARCLCELLARRRFKAPIGRTEFKVWARLLGYSWLNPIAARFSTRRFAVGEDELARADGGIGEIVFFQTRLWDPADTPKEKNITAVNSMRAEAVRVLRKHFGSRFAGGLMRTPYATAHYPELVTPLADDRLSYLQFLQRCRVSVVTTGIHRSIPGKLGESLAAGRCIVTEPLAYELPVALREGTHFLEFRTPDECVAQCERLLADDSLAARMQAANREYYNYHGTVAITVGRCLDIATGRRSAAA